ncbi:MAG: serine hydrolase [Kineosporiaceae bacterium]
MKRRTAAVTAAVAAAVTGLLGWPVTPLSRHVNATTSSDTDLAAQVRAALDDDGGYQALHVSEITASSVRHAGVGSVAPGGRRAFTADTPIELGSITKTFNGMLLADAITRGEVTATDPVSRYLPRLAGSAIGEVTLEELASHRGAVPPFPPSDVLRGLWGAISNTDQLAGTRPDQVLDQVAEMPLLGDRGTVQYSNLGATLLGWALAAAADHPDRPDPPAWNDYVTARLLTPLGMAHTVFATTRAQIPTDSPRGLLTGGRRAFQGVGTTYQPAGCCTWTTAEDITRYVQAILRGTAPGMSALDPRFPARNGSGVLRIGYHWFTSAQDGHIVHWHNGATAGYHTMLALDRTANRAIFIVTNSTRPVDPLAVRLLTGVSGGPAETRPPLPVVGLVLTVLAVFLLIGLVVATIRATTRLQLVRAASGAVLGLSLLRLAGPWDQVPGLVWVLAAMIAAATAAVGVLRIRSRPWHRPRRAVLSRMGAGFALLAAGAGLALGLT